MSTRPRIEFNQLGWCNSCQWMEEKNKLDWSERQRELKEILEIHRDTNGGFDCIVPVSGGKDGSYVAYKLKNDFGMNILTVTVTPALSLKLGDQNLRNFIDSGFNHLQISPDPEAMRILNKVGFIEKGFPYYGWLISIQAAVVRTAVNLRIPLIFYGEDGEVEYGGSTESKNTPMYDVEYMRRIYLEGGYNKVLDSSGLSHSQLYFFRFPDKHELKDKGIKITHWSYFENWDSYRNYLVAKEHCGLKENDKNNSGTFTNFSQNDQSFYALHTYLMYLKFGFGRANQDASIEIRRGAMDRDQAVNLVRIYDGLYPDEFINEYLDYYEMTLNEFNLIIDKWANKDLFEKIDGIWKPKFLVQ